MNDITNDVKLAILMRSIDLLRQQSYDLSTAIEVRRASGYTDAEVAPLLKELERTSKMLDGYSARITELKSPSA